MHNRAKTKLVASTLAMLLALLFLGGATFAWFAVSTAPEISGMTFNVAGLESILLALDDPTIVDPNTLDFKTVISLNDIFGKYTALTPVSTADLTNWFLPTYDLKTGNLNPAEEFILDNNLTYANKYRYKTQYGKIVYLIDGVPTTEVESSSGVSLSSAAMLTGYDLFTAESSGMYVYADVWMKTTDKDGGDVRLSFPHYGVETAAAGNELEGSFGTYVLPKLAVGTDEETGEEYIGSLSRNAETCVRIGMQIFGNAAGTDPAVNKNEVTDWYIYEPNADKRSDPSRKPTDMDKYVLGYNSGNDETDGYYATTYPIGEDPTLGQHAVCGLDPAHLITQMACTWNLGKPGLLETLKQGKLPDSSFLDRFGSFVTGTKMYEKVQGSGFGHTYPVGNLSLIPDVPYAGEDRGLEGACTSQVLFRLSYDKPVRIRLFVWIEGQDTDCWNDIASGDFLVNLEFAAESDGN